jgi:TolB protein
MTLAFYSRFLMILQRMGFGIGLALLSAIASAQLTVEIGGAGTQQYPIALLGLTGDAAADEVSVTARSDLGKSGVFKLLTDSQKLDVAQSPATTALRSAGADAIVWGTVVKNGSQLELRIKIQDAVRGTLIDHSVLTVRADARFAGHQLADHVYEKITGFKGFFSARLAYVTHLARDAFELRVADWDGQFPQVALRSKEPIMSVSFNADASRLAYVSFEGRKASIYTHELATGARKMIANHRGTNSAPTFSPNGIAVAAALSKDGIAQIYTMDLNGDKLRRLAQNTWIDTEPSYSADGNSVFFVSDRGGQPQIYRMSANGGEAQRVTFTGDYNISPAASPDGKMIAYIARRGGRFVTAVMDLATQQETIVSDGGADESPSFVGNSRFVIFASKQRGRGVLVLASIDGKVRSTLSLASADIRDPAFSRPFK